MDNSIVSLLLGEVSFHNKGMLRKNRYGLKGKILVFHGELCRKTTVNDRTTRVPTQEELRQIVVEIQNDHAIVEKQPCFRCKQIGHTRADCKNTRKRADKKVEAGKLVPQGLH